MRLKRSNFTYDRTSGLRLTGGLYESRATIKRTVASLELVSPGAVTDGVNLFTSTNDDPFTNRPQK